METYNQFLDRINSFQNPDFRLGEGKFEVNPNLKMKVAGNNSFKEFYGDTVVFDLDESVKDILLKINMDLYKSARKCFCEMLHPDTFHMTLHDLSASQKLSFASREAFFNEIALIDLLKDTFLCERKILMESTCIFNMTNTSLVLGLKPKSETEYLKLMNLYKFIDKVRLLPYPFTPHITLAYYSHNGFDYNNKLKLEKIVNEFNNSEKLTIELNTTNLFYQKFLSMNDYVSVFKLLR
ncbi:MAG: hypothetical protein U0L20_00850 [Ruminococcus sp.]|nr:hypothetical protein [Ruminococcus sp.]